MKKITLWMLAAILTLCGSVSLTSCSDKDSDGGKDSPDVIELKNKLQGTWHWDADGTTELDMSWVDINFDNNSMKMSVYMYDNSTDEFIIETSNFTYKVLDQEELDGKKYTRLSCKLIGDQLETTQQKLRDDYLKAGLVINEDSLQMLEKDDYFLVDFVDDHLHIMHSLADVPAEYQGKETEFIAQNTMELTKGSKQPGDVDSAYLRTILREARDYASEYEYSQNADETEEASEARSMRRAAATYTGYNNRKLEAWMKDVDDKMLVRNMLLPGTHDAATFAMYGDWMWTLARTQGGDIAEQWNRGIRCFDIRTRWLKDKDGNLKNECFHEMLDCGVSLEKVIDEVVKKVKANPTDGAVLMIKTESNLAAGDDVTSNAKFRGYTDYLFPAGFDRSPSDKVATMKETARLVNEKLLKPGLLAGFKTDMTMKDLRGKVLILLQQAPKQGEVDYGDVQKYIANWGKDHITTMAGDNLAETKEQNMWEIEKDVETEDGFVRRKAEAFRTMLSWSAENYDKNIWVYNAANAYFWDTSFAGTQVIPDYASFAQLAYPIFTADIARIGDPRGIVLFDYVGQEEFKRVSFGALAGGGIVAAVGSLPFVFLCVKLPLAFKTHYTSPLFYNFVVSYYIVKFFSHWKKPQAQALINTIVEVNIPKKGDVNISDDPIDYGRSREIEDKN